MAENAEVKLSLKLDVDTALKQYHSLISQLSKGGVESDITQSLTRELNAAEKEINKINVKASQGFSDSKDIARYNQRLGQITTSLIQLGRQIDKINSDPLKFVNDEASQTKKQIDSYSKEIKTLQKDANSQLTSGLQGLGFSKQEAQNIALAVKNQEQLNDALEKEKQKRIQLYTLTFNAYKNKAGETRQNFAQKNGGNILNESNLIDYHSISSSLKDSSISEVKTFVDIINDSIQENLGKNLNTFEIIEKVNEDISTLGSDLELDDIVKSGEEIESIIQNLVDLRENSVLNLRENKNFVKAAAQRDLIAGGKGELSDAANNVSENYGNSLDQVQTLQAKITDLNSKISKQEEELQELRSQISTGSAGAQENINQAGNSASNNALDLYETTVAGEQLDKTFEKISGRVTELFGVGTAFREIRKVIQQTFQDTQNLDKAFASIAMVTDYSVEDMWSSYGDYADMAAELGQSTQSVIESSALFYQQGLDTAEALSLTEDTMKLATLAGIDYSTATQEMTAA